MSCCTIDWAASQKVPGAGAMLYRHIQSLTGTMINIGGSDDARGVLPRMGFQERMSLELYTRVLRPWAQMRQAPRDWKAPLRWARDARELARTAQRMPAGLSVRRVANFDVVTREALVEAAGGGVCERTAESLNYALACPAAAVEGYVLERERAVEGYFLLSRVGHECRLADLQVHSEDSGRWAEAYAVATAAAAANNATTQIRACAAGRLQAEALRRAGYRRSHAEPVFVLDPGGLLEGVELGVSFLENDAYYWRGEG